MLWGPLSDRFGRRPVFLICLIILTGSCIGLALCPTDAYWLLLVLRCLQAGGCASTIALGKLPIIMVNGRNVWLMQMQEWEYVEILHFQKNAVALLASSTLGPW